MVVAVCTFFIQPNYTINYSSITFSNIMFLYRNKIHFYQIHTRRYYLLLFAIYNVADKREELGKIKQKAPIGSTHDELSHHFCQLAQLQDVEFLLHLRTTRSYASPVSKFVAPIRNVRNCSCNRLQDFRFHGTFEYERSRHSIHN